MILHEVETASREVVEKLQLSRLKETVKLVYKNVPFYKEKLRLKGINPENIVDLEQIKGLPFTTKKDLREQYPFGLFAVDQQQIVRVHASSGTSGKPTVVGYTSNDIQMWSEVVARAIVIGGGQPGDCLHNAYGYGLFTGGLGLHYGSEQLGMMTVPVSGGNSDRQILLIQDFKPTIICGTPSYMLNLAEKMEKAGIDPKATSLSYGIFGAEPWSEKMRERLEKKFNIKACDIYGLSEVIGPGVAMECHEAQDGLHIAEDHFFVEVIDPYTLENLPDGEEGELVFTSLTKEAMPIIRYRTGDIASVRREKCVCGRTSIKMSRVKGRVDDMLIIRGVNVYPSEIEHHLLTVSQLSPHYQLHLKQNHHMDVVELQVEMSEDFFHSVRGDLQHKRVHFLAKEVEHLLKNACLVSIHVTVQKPNSLPRSEGKAIRIVDHRNKVVN
ncbi:AMP-binding protein [Bacillus spongiae]|uniref:Phenylacetate-coenzyme A ligase n=1 Tax=Bacillus spongiae TaxID=2683610 RepID=A0ABU8HCL9_9BACI